MKRDYKDGVQEGITFFVGQEIERTPAFGMKTLFVVGVQDVNVILNMVKNNDCTHIYFGANQSFPNPDINDSVTWRPWEDMINECLTSGFWCTLDLDIKAAEALLESSLTESRRFIPQISVKLPYMQQLGYNATIKIDDKGFEATNPGVWCIPLSELTQRKYFTNWDEYSNDEILL
jgi:hypothetical protein